MLISLHHYTYVSAFNLNLCKKANVSQHNYTYKSINIYTSNMHSSDQ